MRGRAVVQAHEDAVSQAAGTIAKALADLQQAAAAEAEATRKGLTKSRGDLRELVQRFESQLAKEREQSTASANQLTALVSSIDRLVERLDDVSQRLAELTERLAVGVETPGSSLKAAGPSFHPGGEGVTLAVSCVPGFQALMDIHKALQAMDQVASASVERFQEGESRILVQLRSPVSASEVASGLHGATGHALAVEEARPEVMQLRLKVIGS
jgi:uncharacterized phage infection (PIP) family protein YhgE